MITDQDLQKVPLVKDLLEKIDNIDAEYVNRISDEIFNTQPFFLSVLLGYRLDTTPLELEEIMKIYFLIWEYFRNDKSIQSARITEGQFNSVEARHTAMLQYTDGEQDPAEIQKIYDADLNHLKSKTLFAAIHVRLNLRPILANMDPYKKGLILIGIKSFIECFETLEAQK